jgi:hypothetical protein
LFSGKLEDVSKRGRQGAQGSFVLPTFAHGQGWQAWWILLMAVEGSSKVRILKLPSDRGDKGIMARGLQPYL